MEYQDFGDVLTWTITMFLRRKSKKKAILPQASKMLTEAAGEGEPNLKRRQVERNEDERRT